MLASGLGRVQHANRTFHLHYYYLGSAMKVCTCTSSRRRSARASRGFVVLCYANLQLLTSTCPAACVLRCCRVMLAGTAGRLLMDESKLLPFNVERSTGKPKHIMKNNAERLPQTQLRWVDGRLAGTQQLLTRQGLKRRARRRPWQLGSRGWVLDAGHWPASRQRSRPVGCRPKHIAPTCPSLIEAHNVGWL